MMARNMVLDILKVEEAVAKLQPLFEKHGWKRDGRGARETDEFHEIAQSDGDAFADIAAGIHLCYIEEVQFAADAARRAADPTAEPRGADKCPPGCAPNAGKVQPIRSRAR